MTKYQIPRWWAEILDRVSSPYKAEDHLCVSTPFDSDYTNMEQFWEDLEIEYGNVFEWVNDNLSKEEIELFHTTYQQSNFILAYLNGYSKHLFEVVD